MTTDRTATAHVRPAAPRRPAIADRSSAAGCLAERLGGAHAASSRPAARAASQMRDRAPQPQARPAAEAEPDAPQPETQVPFALTVTIPPAAAPATVRVAAVAPGAVAASARVPARAVPAAPVARVAEAVLPLRPSFSTAGR